MSVLKTKTDELEEVSAALQNKRAGNVQIHEYHVKEAENPMSSGEWITHHFSFIQESFKRF